MALTPLAQIINLPEKCPLAEIQGTVVKVYEHAPFNDKTKQNFQLKDSSGTLVGATAWAHDDLSFYQGKEVIIKAGPKGGLAVNNYKGKPGVSVSATCTFQTVAGGTAPQTPVPANHSHSVAPTHTHVAPTVRPVIQGQTIGMAINNACNSLTAQGQPLTKENVWKLASMIVGVSQAMEAGKIHEVPKPAPTASTVPHPAPAPVAPPPAQRPQPDPYEAYVDDAPIDGQDSPF